ncbi:MAG: YfcC family protein [Atopobiaceae bacterium]|nr:YfcC family protein [Atopobiaceae bacterium]MBQ6650208.1 YfcC family protein [Atopobiaceae bacterium]
MADNAQPKKKREMLSSFSIIFILLAIVAIVTIFLNGATYEVNGEAGVVTGATLADFLMSPVRGFADAIDVCLFVMVLGGFLAIVNKTNAIADGIAVLVKKMGGNELKLIPILMAIFAFGGTTYGMCEETVGFYALLSATMMAAGFDTLTGAMIVLLGAGVGCLGSTVNPFAVGAASAALDGVGITGNQMVYIGLGLVLLVVSYIVAVFFVLQYAKMVKADPSRTLLSATEIANSEAAYGEDADAEGREVTLTSKQKGVLVLFAAAFIIMVISFVPWEDLGIDIFNPGFDPDGNSWSSFLTGVPLGWWYFQESTTWFLLLAIIIGIVGGLSEREIVNEFMAGAGDMMSVVMVIALARGVSVLMSSTGLDMFVLAAASNALAGTSGIVFSIGSYILYFVLSFLIPSTSGMAGVSMPIMGPLAQTLGFSPSVMVMVFCAASGVVNLITPTSGAIMGGLALSRVEYTTWVKFCTKIIIVLSVVCMIVLSIAFMVVPA